MYLIGLILGSLEVALTVWLAVLSLEGSFFGIVGFIAYLIWSYFNGGKNVINLLIAIASALVLAIIFLTLGLWWTIAAFIVETIIFEFFPRGKENS
jgi:hypothetical protein